MHMISDQRIVSFREEIFHKMEVLQTPIATIEICIYLLTEETKSNHLNVIKEALLKMRDISKQCMEKTNLY